MMTEEFLEKGLMLEEKTKNPPEKQREQWANDREFFLACVGYCVGLGNVWRFSYLCYQNGGGAFLVPYILVAVLVGMPMYYLEISIGQFMKSGPVKAFNMLPAMKGIGVASVVTCLYTTTYYIMLIAWMFIYFFHSFTTTQLPWSTCDNWWNTKQCISYTNLTLFRLSSNASETSPIDLNAANGSVLSVQEFWQNYVTRRSSGIDDIGTTENWKLLACVVLSWIITYFSVFKGVRSAGKVVYFTALFPYFILAVLVVRSCTLVGAGEGLIYYLIPNFTRLADKNVWIQAGGQVLYSYGICFSVLITFGSYNSFKTNTLKYASLITATSSVTSFISGFSVFGVLGHLAYMTNKNISDVVSTGPDIAFQTYPTVVSFLPFPQLWSVLFFFMMLLLGIDGQFTMVESLTTVITEQFAIRNKYLRKKECLTFIICFILFLTDIPLTFGCGIYVFNLIDNYGVSGFCLFTLVFMESVAFSYFYGINRLCRDFKQMGGYFPIHYIRMCFQLVIPLFCLMLLVFTLYGHSPLQLGSYKYPKWSLVLGWLMSVSSVAFIPIVFLFTVATSNGDSLMEKIRNSMEPQYSHHGHLLEMGIGPEKK